MTDNGYAVKIINYFQNVAKSWVGKVKNAADVRDILVFGGLILLGYGLYLLRPWLGFAVSGGLMMCIGLFVGKRS